MQERIPIRSLWNSTSLLSCKTLQTEPGSFSAYILTSLYSAHNRSLHSSMAAAVAFYTVNTRYAAYMQHFRH